MQPDHWSQRAIDIFAQAGFWLSGDGFCDLHDRVSGIYGVGPPYVFERDEPLFGIYVFGVTMAIGVPSAIKTFNWLGTLWGGKIQFKSPMLFALGFVSLFVSGGLSGLFLAQPVIDNMLHATYYVVAHFHLVMGVAVIFGISAGDVFRVPENVWRTMNELLVKVHFWFTFVGAYCIFMPMHFVGLAEESGVMRMVRQWHFRGCSRCTSS